MYMYYLLGHRLMNKIELWETDKAQQRADNTYLLALDGDVDFQPKAVRMLVDLMRKDEKVGAACGRIHPIGTGEDILLNIKTSQFLCFHLRGVYGAYVIIASWFRNFSVSIFASQIVIP